MDTLYNIKQPIISFENSLPLIFRYRIIPGHFTQVVWRKSEKIGVGIATDGRGTLFAVANYFPAGNFMNQFKENVRPPKN